MSQSPYLMAGARAGLRLGHAQMVDSVIHDGLWDAFNDYHMGITAENWRRNTPSAAPSRTALRCVRSRRRRRRSRPGGSSGRSRR